MPRAGISSISRTAQALDAAVVDDLDRDLRPVLAGVERQRHRAAVRLDQLLVDLGAEVLGQPRPAVLLAGHGEEDLAREEAAAVVVGVEQPHGDAPRVARLDLAGLGVVVVEAVDLDLVLARRARPWRRARSSTSGWPMSQKLLVAGALLLQVLGQQVGVHLRLEERHARPSRGQSSMSLAASGSNWKAAKTRSAGLGTSVCASSRRQLDLALLQRRVLGAEGDDDALRARPRLRLRGRRRRRSGGSRPRRAASECRRAARRGRTGCAGRPCRGCRSSAVRRATRPGAASRRSGRRRRPAAGARRLVRRPSSGWTAGAGTASTVNGPVTRALALVARAAGRRASPVGVLGDGASISSRVMPSLISGLLAMDLSVTCGTVLYSKPLPTPSSGCASS